MMNASQVKGASKMTKDIPVIILAVILSLLFVVCNGGEKAMAAVKGGKIMGEIKLPAAQLKGGVSLEEALAERRSRRDYKKEPLVLKEVAQLLWAAQGMTADWGGKTAPSAGATYPLEVYIVVGKVEGLEPGLYHYIPDSHSMKKVLEGDIRRQLSSAALGQECVADAPVTLVVAAVFRRTTGRYGERGIRYVYIETGHVGQNICLQAEALGLGAVVIGAFRDEMVKGVLKLKEEPLYLIPVGK